MDVNVHDYEIDVFQISFLLLVACSASCELCVGLESAVVTSKHGCNTLDSPV